MPDLIPDRLAAGSIDFPPGGRKARLTGYTVFERGRQDPCRARVKMPEWAFRAVLWAPAADVALRKEDPVKLSNRYALAPLKRGKILK